ncbi:hypothetical protein YC2023_076309 [Brassica napus]
MFGSIRALKEQSRVQLKTRRELTTLEIQDSLIPSLEQLHEEHGDLLSDLAVSFPDPPPPPAEDRRVSSPPPRGLTYSAADVRSQSHDSESRAESDNDEAVSGDDLEA